MPDRWVIRVAGKEYGPVDLATLHDWKSDGRVLPTNPARREDVDVWEIAADIPGLFQAEAPPVQKPVAAAISAASLSHDAREISPTKPPTRNILIETFRIYFRGFLQFFGLALLGIVPLLCAEFTGRFIETGPGATVDLRAMVAAAFGLSMLVLRIVLIPVYIAGIQILTAELATGQRIGLLKVLNGAVKYWPQVAALALFVYGVFFLLTIFGMAIVLMMLAAVISGSLVSIVLALGLAAFQIWLFCRFFVNVLFCEQFVVLENANVYEAFRESKTLARSGRDLPWYQRPLWRGALVVSIWMAFVIGITVVALWPKLTAEWPLLRDTFNQLGATQDPQAVLQKMLASLPKDQGTSFSELSLNLLQRILQPLLGIAFVILYLDSRGE
jgi:GYF domain 2